MNTFFRFSLLGMSAPSAAGSSSLKKEKSSEELHPTLVPVDDVPSLPRVLLIGDSVSMHYTLLAERG